VIELFGIDVHDFIAVLSMIFLIFPTFYLWYYMLVDVYEKNKLHFVFMYLSNNKKLIKRTAKRNVVCFLGRRAVVV
jgi:hypothetical protein